MLNEGVATAFARGFLSRTLAEQVAACEQYELAPLFLELFEGHQPILEAGCGSGRWCAWFANRDMRCDGVDWSRALCERASHEIPECRFFAADMQSMPVADGEYGGLVALGSVEHVPEGPVAALREFHRVLRADGVAIITVPYGGPIRRMMRLLQRPAGFLRTQPLLRRVFGKASGGRRVSAAKRQTTPQWYPRFGHGSEGWFFYEYEFNKPQMRFFLGDAGLRIEREFVGFGDEGILHTFGRPAGRWNAERSAVDLNGFGRFLRKCLPVSQIGHMLCYVVSKPPTG